MQVLAHVAALFTLTLALHLVWWRIALPVHQRRGLLRLFSALLVVYLGASAVLAERWPTAVLAPAELAQVGLCYVSLMLSYVATYSMIEADSPTLSLLLFVSGQGAEGRLREDLESFLLGRSVLQDRLEAMLVDGMLVERDGRYHLATGSFLAFRLILAYKRLFDSGQGG